MRSSPRQPSLPLVETGPYLTLTEVATRLGRGEQAVHRAIRVGALSAVYLSPKQVRVHEAEVRRLINELRAGDRRSTSSLSAAMSIADATRRQATAESRADARSRYDDHQARLAAVRAIARGQQTPEQMRLLIHGRSES